MSCSPGNSAPASGAAPQHPCASAAGRRLSPACSARQDAPPWQSRRRLIMHALLPWKGSASVFTCFDGPAPPLADLLCQARPSFPERRRPASEADASSSIAQAFAPAAGAPRSARARLGAPSVAGDCGASATTGIRGSDRRTGRHQSPFASESASSRALWICLTRLSSAEKSSSPVPPGPPGSGSRARTNSRSGGRRWSRWVPGGCVREYLCTGEVISRTNTLLLYLAEWWAQVVEMGACPTPVFD